MYLIEITELPEELRNKFLELRKLLKVNYSIDVLSKDVGDILDIFGDTFRPLLVEFQDGKIGVEDVAVKIQEYSERLRLLTSVIKYATDRYGVDFREGVFYKVLQHNLEGATKHILQMNHDGKSLEEAYRYMLSQAIVIMDDGRRVQ